MPGYGRPNPMLGGRDQITQALMNIANPPPGGPGGGMDGGMGGGMMQPAAPVGGMAGMPAPMPGSQPTAFGAAGPGPMGPIGGPMAPSMNLPGLDVNATPPGVKQQASRGY
jgi:hypothetical protein